MNKIVQYNEIQELLRSRADLHARLNLMPYDGTPEIRKSLRSIEQQLAVAGYSEDELSTYVQKILNLKQRSY